MPTGVQDNLFEWKLGYLMPVFFVVGALVNLAVSNALGLTLTGFNALSIHAKNIADYGIDAFDLAFAPVDPDIINDLNGDGVAERDGVSEPSINPLSSPPPADPLLQPTAPTIEDPGVVETVSSIVDDTLETIENNLEGLLPEVPLPRLPSLFP